MELDRFAGKRLFLSGPMDGLPEYNHAAFNEAAERWRKVADCVWNPAELFGGDLTRRRVEYQRKNLAELTKPSTDGTYYDGLVLLPGWNQSKGSKLEISIAMELGMFLVLDETRVECAPMTHVI